MICALCNTEVPPYYRGPIGHAPENACLECWLDYWEVREFLASTGGDPGPMDWMLFLRMRGMSQCDAALIIGVHRNTIARWIGRIRRFPELMPEWVKESS